MTGLLGFKSLCQKYEYETKEEERLSLYFAFDSALQSIGDLVNALMPMIDQSESALYMVYLIVKILYSANQCQLCPQMMQPGALEPWVMFLKAVLDRQVPLDCEMFNTEDNQLVQSKEKNLNWKIKGIASKLSYRIFQKYSTSKELPEADNENIFKNSFTLQLVPALLDSHM